MKKVTGNCAKGILLALVLCIMAGFPGQSAAKKPTLKWKIGTLAPKGIGWAKHCEALLDPAVKKETNGYLKFKWYWGGVMGDDNDHVQKMRIGQLQGMAFSPQGLVIAVPELSVLQLPFLFNNFEEVEYVKYKLYSKFDDLAEKHGFKLVYLVDADFDQIYSTTQKIEKLEDFKKATFITWAGPIEELLLKKLGASPVPVSLPEISASIRSGVANALIVPALWCVGAQMYTVTKYVTPAKIRYSPGGLMVTMDAWKELPEEYQKKLIGFRYQLEKPFAERTRKDSQKALDAMIKYGVQKVEIKPAELERIREQCSSLWYDLADQWYPKELLDEILALLKEYRAKKQ